MIDRLIEQIMRDLPNVPEEAVRTWLAPHAAREGFGWPPKPNTPWTEILMGRPLSWWQDCTWHGEQLPMHLELMASVARFQVEQLLDAASAGQDLMPDSRQRIDRISSEIARTGTWFAAPIAFPDVSGLGLADGYHRLAALTRLRRSKDVSFDTRHRVWIALNRS